MTPFFGPSRVHFYQNTGLHFLPVFMQIFFFAGWTLIWIFLGELLFEHILKQGHWTLISGGGGLRLRTEGIPRVGSSTWHGRRNPRCGRRGRSATPTPALRCCTPRGRAGECGGWGGVGAQIKYSPWILETGNSTKFQWKNWNPKH